MSSQEVLAGYLDKTFGSVFNSQNIDCIFPTAGKPTQGWFNLFQIAEALKFKYNFSVTVTKPESIIQVIDSKTNSMFAEIGLIQLLICAHPDLGDRIKEYATWQLYDNSPMVNGFFGKDRVQFQYNGGGLYKIEFNANSKKEISYLLY